MSNNNSTTVANLNTSNQPITPEDTEGKLDINPTNNENSNIAANKDNSTPETELGSHAAERKFSDQPSQADQKPEVSTQDPSRPQNSPTGASNSGEAASGGNANGNILVTSTPTTNQVSQADDKNSPKTTNIKGLKAGMGVSWGFVAAGIVTAIITLALMLASPISIPLYAVLIPVGIVLAASIPAIKTTVSYNKEKQLPNSTTQQNEIPPANNNTQPPAPMRSVDVNQSPNQTPQFSSQNTQNEDQSSSAGNNTYQQINDEDEDDQVNRQGAADQFIKDFEESF